MYIECSLTCESGGRRIRIVEDLSSSKSRKVRDRNDVLREQNINTWSVHQDFSDFSPDRFLITLEVKVMQ